METAQNKRNAINELQLTAPEETAWYESGLSADGVDLDAWDEEAIVRYGRLLHQQLLNEMHELRLQNSAQAAIIERLKLERDTHKDAFRYMYFMAIDLCCICEDKFVKAMLRAADECHDGIVNTLGNEHRPQR